ncbi:MAG: formylglycine-generating enzyme family protein, partial [Elusimicrobiota bacterium]
MIGMSSIAVWTALMTATYAAASGFDGAKSVTYQMPAFPRPTIPAALSIDALDGRFVGVAAKFIMIGPGTFTMGSPAEDATHRSDETSHRVRLTKAFEMQATEVTQLQYFLVMGSNPSHWVAKDACDPGNHRVIGKDNLCMHHPVEFLTWRQVDEFIRRLNKLQRKYTYRLPTEAEWEYVARAGSMTQRPFAGSLDIVSDYDA